MVDLDLRGVEFEASNFGERSRILSYGWEPDYLAAMLAALRSDDVLYDIGANVGLVALHAARICQTIAFEPDPAFLSRLQRNVQLNPELHVKVLPTAIGDAVGEAKLFTDGHGGNSPSLVHQRGERGEAKVAVTTLDTLVEAGTLPEPTVVKLDIEGAEILALRGARQLLEGPRPPRALFLEVHGSFLSGFGSSAEEVMGLVRQAGYDRVGYEAHRSNEHHLILERH